MGASNRSGSVAVARMAGSYNGQTLEGGLLLAW